MATQLATVRDTAYTRGDDLFINATAHDPANVQDSNGDALTDSNYSTPPEQQAQSSPVEVSSDVAQAPDNTGTIVQSTDTPGGFQVTFASLYDDGTSGRETDRPPLSEEKRPIFGRDTVVLWAKSPTATGDIDFELSTEQDW